jgi:GNAT superfamily N-acetyltransferase
MKLEHLRGAQIESRIDVLAALRIAVFREWPYLYKGSAEYEKHYLQPYLRCADSLVLLVWDGAHCVGASTVIPLPHASAEAQAPFHAQGDRLEEIAYFGESVLLKPYRGRGFGVRFFEERETHARALGLSRCVFCSVQRAENDPRRPADWVPNDAFWTHRGYRPLTTIKTEWSWPDIGEQASSAKPMKFWERCLP